MVDTSEWGGELLRQQVSGHDAAVPTLVVYEDGYPQLYQGRMDPGTLSMNLALLAEGHSPIIQPPSRGGDASTGDEMMQWASDQPADAVIEVSTPAQYLSFVTTFPHVLMLFFSSERPHQTLHSNFTAAASALYEQQQR